MSFFVWFSWLAWLLVVVTLVGFVVVYACRLCGGSMVGFRGCVVNGSDYVLCRHAPRGRWYIRGCVLECVVAAHPCPHRVWKHRDHIMVLVQGPPRF